MGRPAERIPQFFKVFDAAKFSNQLHVPSAYASHMRGNLPSTAFLGDQYGNRWPVKLAKIGSEWYFGEGWEKVVQDSSLETKDVLIFQFDGDKIFHFKIMGTDSYDKVGVGSLKFPLKDKEMGRGEGEKEQADQDSKLSGRDARKLCKGQGAGRKEAAAADAKKRKAKVDAFGADIFGSGLIRQPKNPYFVTKIRPKRRREVYVPADVIDTFKLKLPEKIILRDPDGRTWLSELTTWKDGRSFYTGGWRSLSMVNLIAAEDTCVCEFVLGRGEPVLKVQIIRGQNAPAL